MKPMLRHVSVRGSLQLYKIIHKDASRLPAVSLEETETRNEAREL